LQIGDKPGTDFAVGDPVKRAMRGNWNCQRYLARGGSAVDDD